MVCMTDRADYDYADRLALFALNQTILDMILYIGNLLQVRIEES